MKSFSALRAGVSGTEEELSESIQSLVAKGLLRPVANGWELTAKGRDIGWLLKHTEHAITSTTHEREPFLHCNDCGEEKRVESL